MIIERLMRPDGIVEHEVIGDGDRGFLEGREFVEIDAFVLQ